MKKKTYEELSNEELLKKRDLFKVVAISFTIIYLVFISFIIYLLATKGMKNMSIAVFVPFFTLPTIFLPLLINFGMLNKEIKSRQL